MRPHWLVVGRFLHEVRVASVAPLLFQGEPVRVVRMQTFHLAKVLYPRDANVPQPRLPAALLNELAIVLRGTSAGGGSSIHARAEHWLPQPRLTSDKRAQRCRA